MKNKENMTLSITLDKGLRKEIEDHLKVFNERWITSFNKSSYINRCVKQCMAQEKRLLKKIDSGADERFLTNENTNTEAGFNGV